MILLAVFWFVAEGLLYFHFNSLDRGLWFFDRASFMWLCWDVSWGRFYPPTWLWLSGLDVTAVRSGMLIGFHVLSAVETGDMWGWLSSLTRLVGCSFVSVSVMFFGFVVLFVCIFAHISTYSFYLFSLIVGVGWGQKGYMGRVGVFCVFCCSCLSPLF